MKIVRKQRVADFSLSPIRECHSDGFAAEASRHDTVSAIRWVERPIPVWQTDTFCDGESVLLSIAHGVFARNFDSFTLEDLFEQRKVGAVP